MWRRRGRRSACGRRLSDQGRHDQRDAIRRVLVRRLRTRLIASLKPQGISVDGVTIRTVPWPAFGDERAAERISVRLSEHGITGVADVDLVLVRVGRGIAIASFGQVETPFDPTLERQLANTVTRRLAADVGRAP